MFFWKGTKRTNLRLVQKQRLVLFVPKTFVFGLNVSFWTKTSVLVQKLLFLERKGTKRNNFHFRAKMKLVQNFQLVQKPKFLERNAQVPKLKISPFQKNFCFFGPTFVGSKKQMFWSCKNVIFAIKLSFSPKFLN